MMDHHVSTLSLLRTTSFFQMHRQLEKPSEILFDSGFEIDAMADAHLGICTRYRQFCYSGTNAAVFEICRKLCEAGGNPSGVAQELYEREKP